MRSTDSTVVALDALSRACAVSTDDALLTDAAEPLRLAVGARAVLVATPAGVAVLAGALSDAGATGGSATADPATADPATADPAIADFVKAISARAASADWVPYADLPPAWRMAGIVAVRAVRLAYRVVLLAWDVEPDTATADVAVNIVATHHARLAAAAELADLIERVDNAQRLANMGDYDWNAVTDTNRWSDQLYRIYGHEPQAFNASFERFLSFIHPDDQERIGGIIQNAYATGEPYQMIERIVRPDGSVRVLSSNGQVVHDATGAAVRIRGTCIDITDRVVADQERERSAARFRELVEASPDAIVVVAADGRIAHANGRATELLGGDLVGTEAAALFPWPKPDGQDVAAIGTDGRPLRLDIVTADLSPAGGERQRAAFLHDALPRLTSETLAATLREAQVRRLQALELNDNVVQGLTAAGLAAGKGDLEASSSYLERTLTAARTMMDDWLDPLGRDRIEGGDLVRSQPSRLEPRVPASRPPESSVLSSNGTSRVLIVDDNEDLRMLARLQIEATPGCVVVGEAGDGEQAVALASELHPDVVLLDLAMPRMDGLQALPLLLEAVPGVRVVVMSGFDEGSLAPRLLETGAARYVEKGVRMDLGAVVQEVLNTV